MVISWSQIYKFSPKARNKWKKVISGSYDAICIHDGRFSILSCDNQKIETYRLSNSSEWIIEKELNKLKEIDKLMLSDYIGYDNICSCLIENRYIFIGFKGKNYEI